ncbi:hypothetical protein [Hymenobacter yonginensis]|uniref:Outer membrane protein beta-barrel domain-containing protein n=1 Tax=Hymenobacter yonginensis TaxID=748197 RepID=A0ABY7PPE8_9BACT|nr:hypothetical protein [Hymenobacter yonginensis]WBO84068.1 hypothetical protein O9Z63_17025 [Hymenobacter yonginensis]
MRHLLLPLLSATLLAGPALAQTSPDTPNPDAVAPHPWFRPRHLILQTAGGMGMVAGGVGYSFLRDRTEADVLVGYVPKKHAGSTLSIATLKLLYTPYTVPLGEKLELRPLTFGPYVSYTHGIVNDGEEDQYTKGYYWFSRNTRVGVVLGGRLTYKRPTLPSGRSHRVSAYYELGTNDLYVVSYFSNGNFRSLSPMDILTLGLGLKAEF